MLSQQTHTSSYWIHRLRLTPHPEGGYFREVYRPQQWKPIEGMPTGRRILTTIYYLLENKDFSAFHRIQSPESWFFHEGMPLLIYSFEEGTLICKELSDQETGELQITIEPNTWFAACLKEPEGFTLVSCAVAPGFEYTDFELANQTILMDEYPHYKQDIQRLTRL